MKNLKILFTLLVTLLVFSHSQAQRCPQIIGKWKGEDVVFKSLKEGVEVPPFLIEAGKQEIKQNRTEIRTDGTITIQNSYDLKSGTWQLIRGFFTTSMSPDVFRLRLLGKNKLVLKAYLSLKLGKIVNCRKYADLEVKYIYLRDNATSY